MTKFEQDNLAAELEAGRVGKNELYDDANLLRAFGNASWDLGNHGSAWSGWDALQARREMFRAEILLRMKRKGTA